MIPCRIFTGKIAEGYYHDRFATGDRRLVYILDEIALKAQTRYDEDMQSFLGLANGKVKTAFQEGQNYDIVEYLEKFVKPCYLLDSPGHRTTLPTGRELDAVAHNYRVWVEIQPGAVNLTTPCVGQLIYIGNVDDIEAQGLTEDTFDDPSLQDKIINQADKVPIVREGRNAFERGKQKAKKWIEDLLPDAAKELFD